MSSSSMIGITAKDGEKIKVWYKLLGVKQPTKVVVDSSLDIDDLKKVVKENHPNALSHFDAPELLVFPNIREGALIVASGDSGDDEDDDYRVLDPCEAIPEGTTSKHPLIIKVPSPDPTYPTAYSDRNDATKISVETVEIKDVIKVEDSETFMSSGISREKESKVLNTAKKRPHLLQRKCKDEDNRVISQKKNKSTRSRRTESLGKKKSANKQKYVDEVLRRAKKEYLDWMMDKNNEEGYSCDNKCEYGKAKIFLNHTRNCHICHTRKPKVIQFACGFESHLYCEKHCMDRLGLDISKADKIIEYDSCPICCLQCTCAVCSRDLQSFAEDLKKKFIKQGMDLHQTEMELSRVKSFVCKRPKKKPRTNPDSCVRINVSVKPINGLNDSMADGNIDYCIICDKSGDLICCDKCPRAFHDACLGISGECLPDSWECPRCIIDETSQYRDIKTGKMSIDNISKAFNHLEKVGTYNDHSGKVLMLSKIHEMLTYLIDFDFGYAFGEPVDIVAFPDYRNIVKHPIDLGTISSSLFNGSYCKRSEDSIKAMCRIDPSFTQMDLIILEVLKDIERVYQNCFLYNPEGSTIYRMALVQQKRYHIIRKCSIDDDLSPCVQRLLITFIRNSKNEQKNRSSSLKGEHKRSNEASMDKIKEIDTSSIAPLTKYNTLISTPNFLENTGKAVGIVDPMTNTLVKQYSSVVVASKKDEQKNSVSSVKDEHKSSVEDSMEKIKEIDSTSIAPWTRKIHLISNPNFMESGGKAVGIVDPMTNSLVKQYSSVIVASKKDEQNYRASSLKGEHKSTNEASMDKIKEIDTSSNAPLTKNNHLISTPNFLENSGKAASMTKTLVKQYSSVTVASKKDEQKNKAPSVKSEHKSSVEVSMRKVKEIDTSSIAPLTKNNHLISTPNFLENSVTAVGIVDPMTNTLVKQYSSVTVASKALGTMFQRIGQNFGVLFSEDYMNKLFCDSLKNPLSTIFGYRWLRMHDIKEKNIVRNMSVYYNAHVENDEIPKAHTIIQKISTSTGRTLASFESISHAFDDWVKSSLSSSRNDDFIHFKKHYIHKNCIINNIMWKSVLPEIESTSYSVSESTEKVKESKLLGQTPPKWDHEHVKADICLS